MKHGFFFQLKVTVYNKQKQKKATVIACHYLNNK